MKIVIKTPVNKEPYLLILLLFFLAFSCNWGRIDNKRELNIKERIQEDSINKCEIVKSEALEQINRGNIILYRNFDNYIHAQEFFLNKYEIILLPEIATKKCAQKIMDSIIFKKFGEDILLIANKELSEIYKTTPDNQYINGINSYAEKLPEYPGGIDSLYCDIYNSVNSIKICKINYEFGNEIIVNFIVNIEGNIMNPKVVMKLCPEIDEQIINTLRKMKKKWSPAINGGKEVPYIMTLHIDWKEKDVQMCKH
jgi:hypothetical protein